MAKHYLWAGTALLITSVLVRNMGTQDWWFMALVAFVGMFMIICSFSEREVAR